MVIPLMCSGRLSITVFIRKEPEQIREREIQMGSERERERGQDG